MRKEGLGRGAVGLFLLTEGLLYGAFLYWDLTVGGPGSNLIKYASILLCALFSMGWALLGGGERLVAAALALTAGADTFLVALVDHYVLGMALFCAVQLCYLLRVRRMSGRSWPWGRLVLCLLSLAGLRALGLWNLLDGLALVYFSNFLCSALLSLSCQGKRARWFSAGLFLYLCCDVCVAFFQFPQLLQAAAYAFVRVGMWLFYLPGQVLIVLSGLPDSIFRGDKT